MHVVCEAILLFQDTIKIIRIFFFWGFRVSLVSSFSSFLPFEMDFSSEIGTGFIGQEINEFCDYSSALRPLRKRVSGRIKDLQFDSTKILFYSSNLRLYRANESFISMVACRFDQ